MSPMATTLFFKASSCSSNLRFMALLTVPSFDVVLGVLVLWPQENIKGWTVLNDLSHEHKNALVARPARLGHVVGHDHDSITLAHRRHQVLDGLGPLSVEGGA